MPVLSVGRPYNPRRLQWPEGAQVRFSADGHELVFFFRRPTAREVTAVETGTARFGVLVRQPVILFCYDFGDGAVPWSDTTFCHWKLPEAERTLPKYPETGDQRALLSVILVDSDTGITRAIRAVSLSNEVTRVIADAVRVQSESANRDRDFDGALAVLFGDLPTVADVVRQAAFVRCVGGQ